MGTSGLKVIRYRNTYFAWWYNHDGFPEALGMMVYKLIPQDSAAFEGRIEELRTEMDIIFETHVADLEVEDSDVLDTVVEIDGEEVVITSRVYHDVFYDNFYIYEIDLDNNLFWYQGFPAYHLDNMPPEDVFIHAADISDDKYCYTTFRNETPEAYRFDLGRLTAPIVEDEQLIQYERHFASTVSQPHAILPLRSNRLSRSEDLCLHVLGNRASILLENMQVVLFKIFGLATGGWKAIRHEGRAIAHLLAAMALLPFYTLGRDLMYSRDHGSFWATMGAEDEFWFMRRHICFTLATHLLDEKNAKYHVSRVVDKIMSTSETPDVVYGVAFSLFHCIVLSVDKTAGGSFVRTEVLEFVSPAAWQSGNWLTPGMEVLTQLGHLRAADDIEFFHHNLSARWWLPRDSERYRMQSIRRHWVRRLQCRGNARFRLTFSSWLPNKSIVRSPSSASLLHPRRQWLLLFLGYDIPSFPSSTCFGDSNRLNVTDAFLNPMKGKPTLSFLSVSRSMILLRYFAFLISRIANSVHENAPSPARFFF